MTEKESHINYTIEDIERYLSGGMTAKEMHDLEHAALKDPFLADAIEGYSQASFQTSYQHLNEITAALYKKQEDAKIVPIAPKKFYWLKIAAVISVVAITSALSWYIINGNNSPEKNNASTAVAEPRVPYLRKADSIFTSGADSILTSRQDSPLVIAELKKRVPAPSSKKIVSKNKEEKSIAAQDSISFSATDAKALNVEVEYELAVAEKKAAESLAMRPQYQPVEPVQRSTVFNGRVTDINNIPVPNATIIADGNIATVTDTQGFFSLRSNKDSLLNVNVSSVGYERAETMLRSNAANNIRIEPDDKTLSEIVVTGLNTDKSLEKRKTDAPGSYPSGGWESFQEYVHRQLDLKMDTTLNNVKVLGDVELEFVIDNDGTPEDFKVLKSLNAAADNKAIEIVKKGPKWIANKKNKKGRVSIQF